MFGFLGFRLGVLGSSGFLGGFGVFGFMALEFTVGV